MDIGLAISMLGNVLAIVAMAVLAAELSGARLDLADRDEAVADLKLAYGTLEQVNGELLSELTEHRAKAEQVRAGALRASAASAAKRKNGGVNAH